MKAIKSVLSVCEDKKMEYESYPEQQVGLRMFKIKLLSHVNIYHLALVVFCSNIYAVEIITIYPEQGYINVMLSEDIKEPLSEKFFAEFNGMVYREYRVYETMLKNHGIISYVKYCMTTIKGEKFVKLLGLSYQVLRKSEV